MVHEFACHPHAGAMLIFSFVTILVYVRLKRALKGFLSILFLNFSPNGFSIRL